MPEYRDSKNDTLSDVVHRYALRVTSQQIEQCEAYCQLLWQWNERLNLTRHTDFEKFVSRDLVDSLQLAALLEPGESVLDVGTGGGVPGVPVAILRPDVIVALCESVSKRSLAVTDIVRQLNLASQVFPQRVEQVLAERQFDVLTARAVGSMSKILRVLQPYWGSIGRLLLIKGPQWTEERGEARHRGHMRHLQLRKLAEYEMPASGSRSVILAVWPKASASGPEPRQT